MEEVSIRELKNRTSDVMRKVRELKEPVAVTYRGHVVANIVPVEESPKETDREKALRVWAEMDRLTAEIARISPPGPSLSAVELVREQRREL